MENINVATLLGHLSVYLFVWVFAITAQAAVTAWMANRFGDDTAKLHGRVTLNPFVQADLVGTIIIPGLAFVLGWVGGGIPFLAWGKGVPIDSSKFRQPKIAGVMVALASVFTNIGLALISFGILKAMYVAGISNHETLSAVIGRASWTTAESSWFAPLESILWYALLLNLALAIISLIPVPPLAGGAVWAAILPAKYRPTLKKIEPFGMIIVLMLLYFGVLGYFLNPLLSIMLNLL